MTKFLTLVSVLFLGACAVQMSPQERHKFLSEVNTKVNSEIKYVHEKTDVWHTYDEVKSSGKGDCEEYAIVKCVLVEKRISDPKILVALHRKNKSAHAVLMVDDYILDNNSKKLYSVDDFTEKWDVKLALGECAAYEIEHYKGTSVRGMRK